ncbi:transcriptional regulator [Bacillus sp. MUM 116]|uniref:helix-turn-helix domain-containing protein n=1 Tax=Bacillus sp. MUM 116 TaxID=1678002 RepID=UPI0008F59485|nr:helix-turn-helix transcriptional regulator [Bacillus sp. MUM 116]OIK14226.1 transcriptional regulator [Bacillus sp. MUM 116]
MDQFSKELGAKINKYRKAINMSTTVLSELSETSQGTISKIENGHSTTNIETLIKICNALGVSLYEILPDNVSPNLKVDNPDKRQLLKVLNQMSESEIKMIRILLTKNIMPVLKSITPVIKAIDELDDKERVLLTDLLDSITNNK